MQPTLDLQARRHFLAMALMSHARQRLGARLPLDSHPSTLLALVRRLGEGNEAGNGPYGFRFEPAYPGATAGPEQVAGGVRMVLACTASARDATPLGVVFTTLIPGRAPQVSVAPPGAPIPDTWHPLADLS